MESGLGLCNKGNGRELTGSILGINGTLSIRPCPVFQKEEGAVFGGLF